MRRTPRGAPFVRLAAIHAVGLIGSPSGSGAVHAMK
jgi:hypothetical protein